MSKQKFLEFKKIRLSKHVPNSVKVPCEEVQKTLVLNQTHWAEPPNAWLLRKDTSLKTFFFISTSPFSSCTHDFARWIFKWMRWININDVFQLFITTVIYIGAEQACPRCAGDETGSRTAKKGQILFSMAQKSTNLSNITAS